MPICSAASASGRPGTQAWVTPHLLGGLGIGAAIGWCFLGQLPKIRAQSGLIDEVMQAVRRERQARGLDVDASLPA